MKNKKLSLTCCFSAAFLTFSIAAGELQNNISQYMNSWALQSDQARLAQLEQVVTEQFQYIDPTTQNNGIKVEGALATSQWIADFHTNMQQFGLWPITVELDSNIDIIGTEGAERRFRFNWAIIGPEGSHFKITGVDFGIADHNNQLVEINGFFGDLLPVCQAPTWSENQTYLGGQQVTYRNQTWQAKWWTQQIPGSDLSTRSEWTLLNDCAVIQ